jgi:hypothetical protein
VDCVTFTLDPPTAKKVIRNTIIPGTTVIKNASSFQFYRTKYRLDPVSVHRTNIASMGIMSHKDCGLNYTPMSQMVRSHVKKLANEIDVLDQSEEGLHQRKGNTKNKFSKRDEWD